MFVFKNKKILICCFCELKTASAFLIANQTVTINKNNKVKFT